MSKKEKKEELGFKNLKAFILVLVGKWKLINENKTLWIIILECMYGVIRQGEEKVVKFSSLWRRDLHVLDKEEGRFSDRWVDNKLSKVIGDETKTYFWKDPWLEGVRPKDKYLGMCKISKDKEISVCEAIRNENGRSIWNEE